ncbi:MAG: type secretion system protein VirB9 [Rickettsiaceae bacterium]|jgi:type IV secretion system protein VirB9|nr:type secretion system protein VirB9 [Rickettsiaceae bacterium]
MQKLYSIIFFVLFTIGTPHAQAALPIATDSRIKTFVYNENEVFHLTLHYGYQSNIEFAIGEEIETLSVGNSYSWKITPVDRRLFIKPLEGSAKTNMTVITNKRTYQFELESKDPTDSVDEELVYVVRFFYPSESFDNPLPKIDTKRFMPENVMGSVPENMSVPAAKAPASGIKSNDNFNYNYTLTGPDKIAPLKVFDDGERTYFKFPNSNATLPSMFIVGDNGAENRTSYARQGDYIVVKQIIKKMALRLGKEVVYVFNESMK